MQHDTGARSAPVAKRLHDNGEYDRSYVYDNLSRPSSIAATGSTGVSHDARGNISAVGSDWAAYTSENFPSATTSALTLPNPRLRPHQVYNTGTGGAVRFDYLGDTLIAEYNTSNAIVRRYVPGPGTDEPVLWYEGSGTSTRQWFHADERGSVIAVSDSSGNLVGSNPNRYDEYGVAQGTLTGRFGYTGQAWLPELGLYDYRARNYNPGLGRFMQTDPIGYGGGMNLYAYVRNDPVNRTDPAGLCEPHTYALVKTTDWGSVKSEQVILDKWIELTGCESPPITGTSGGGHSHPGTGESGEAVVVTALWRPEDRSEELFRRLSANQTQLPPGYLPYPESGGRMMYRADDPRRTPVLTPERQRQACQDYDRLMHGNAVTGAEVLGLQTFFRKGPISWLLWIGNAVNAALSFSPRPPGCQ